MIEIVIYGLIAFIVLVAGTFLFDKMKVKAQEAKAAEEKRKKDREAFLAAQPPKPVPRPRPAAKPATPGPFSTTTMSKSTMNGRPMTMQELNDFFNGKTTDITKQTDAAIAKALKEVEDEMKRLDKIFKRK